MVFLFHDKLTMYLQFLRINFKVLAYVPIQYLEPFFTFLLNTLLQYNLHYFIFLDNDSIFLEFKVCYMLKSLLLSIHHDFKDLDYDNLNLLGLINKQHLAQLTYLMFISQDFIHQYIHQELAYLFIIKYLQLLIHCMILQKNFYSIILVE